MWSRLAILGGLLVGVAAAALILGGILAFAPDPVPAPTPLPTLVPTLSPEPTAPPEPTPPPSPPVGGEARARDDMDPASRRTQTDVVASVRGHAT